MSNQTHSLSELLDTRAERPEKLHLPSDEAHRHQETCRLTLKRSPLRRADTPFVRSAPSLLPLQKGSIAHER